MKLFLDSSTLLGACGSSTGASRYILEQAPEQKWQLISSGYCHAEVRRNVYKLGESATVYFRNKVAAQLAWVDDIVTSEKIVIFSKSKDRPVLLSAAAADSEVFLTLDRKDFQDLLGAQFYGMQIQTPGNWLQSLRSLQP